MDRWEKITSELKFELETHGSQSNSSLDTSRSLFFLRNRNFRVCNPKSTTNASTCKGKILSNGFGYMWGYIFKVGSQRVICEGDALVQLICDSQVAMHIVSNPLSYERTDDVEVYCHSIRKKN